MTCHFLSIPNLHFTDTGQGTPVVLLHGSASSGKQWRSLTDHLKGHFRIITPDLPGYGRSAIPATTRQSLKDSAQSIVTVIDQIEEPVHLVGHSFGGAVALKIATLWPEKIRSLTLIEPAAFSAFWAEHGLEATETSDFIALGQSVGAQLSRGQTHNAMKQFIDFWNGKGTWQRSSFELQAKLAPAIVQVLNDFDALSGDTMTEWELAGVVCPVQILRGDTSPAVMATLAHNLVSKLPFATQTVFANAGHMLPLTDPHLVDPAIDSFIKNVDRTLQSCVKSIALAA